MNKTLLVTNDFPPRPGGIQQFVHNLAIRQPAGSLVVYASTWKGAAKFDADQPFEVVRENTGMLLPTPAVARRAAQLARSHSCDTVWFGAAAPLGLLAAGLRRRAGIGRAVAHAYHPGVDGSTVRRRYGLSDRPVIVCVSRLVPRKGQDALIRALPAVRRRVPDAALLLVSGGPYRDRLRRLAGDQPVYFTGPVPWSELPEYYAAGDVFAMPCRTRRAGLDVEGLGIVFLEASATGLPVVAGDSGGSPDAVRDGQTGYLVDGRDIEALADRLATLLTDRDLARRMGTAGRAWVEAEWRWDTQADRMAALLAG